MNLTNRLLYLWQLPQNVIGKAAVALLKAEYHGKYYVHYNDKLSSVSLGSYIVLQNRQVLRKNVFEHESGHQKQSILLGPLYLLLIGLPSVIGNLLHRHFKFDYYKQPWEAWADKLGGVVR